MPSKPSIEEENGSGLQCAYRCFRRIAVVLPKHVVDVYEPKDGMTNMQTAGLIII